MSRFLVWFRWEWREHWKLVVGCAAGAVFFSWIALVIGRSGMSRDDVEVVVLVQLALLALILAAGLYGSERRHAAEPIVLRTPGARVPLFLARLAFFATAWGGAAAAAAFGAARVAQMESGRASLQPPELGTFLWPRWYAADFVSLALALGAIALLVSVWTRRVAVALVVSLLVLAAVLFPWIRLGADRSDFFPFLRMGAIPFATWPLLLLALIALSVSWFIGRRHINRPWHAFRYGVLVLFVGMGLAGLWTAKAVADFDEVHADMPGFRMHGIVVNTSTSHGAHSPLRMDFLPLNSVALTPDGNTVWVQGLRRDAGLWPKTPGDPHGPDAQDFRAHRGTYSWQWRIDLTTGKAERVGRMRERIGWNDLGSGEHFGVLRRVDRTARMGTRAFALFGRLGHADEGRFVDLATGTTPTNLSKQELARAVAASSTGVRDAEGRPVWLEHELARDAAGRTIPGSPRLFIATAEGRKAVEDADFLRQHHPLGAPAGKSALAIPGGWGLHTGSGFATLDAVTGRVRKTTDAQARGLVSYRGSFVYLDTRYVLADRGGRSDDPTRSYRLLDLEEGTFVDRTGPMWHWIVPTATPDRRVLCISRTEGGRAFALWSPRTDERTPLAIEGESAPFAEQTYPRIMGTDSRGNMVLSVITHPIHTEHPYAAVRTLYYRAQTQQLFALDGGPGTTTKVPAFQPIGIDAQDRVVGLADNDRSGFRSIVRFDPADGSLTTVFPRVPGS